MSSDDKKKNLNAWLSLGAKAGAKPAQSPAPSQMPPSKAAEPNQGPSGDMLRKMAAINPALKGGDTTGAFVQAAKETLRGETPSATQKSAAPRNSEGPLADARDADHLMQLAFARYEGEKRTLETELAMLQAKASGLKEKHLQEVMDKLADLDPNLSSVVTQASIQQNKRFLDGLGFSPQRFIEHLRKRR